MSATYFWDGEKVITDPTQITTSYAEPYKGMFCVDLFETVPSRIYGKFLSRGAEKLPYWAPVPYDEFPKEFKTWLLLLT